MANSPSGARKVYGKEPCQAIKKDGKQCVLWSVSGGTRCRLHLKGAALQSLQLRVRNEVAEIKVLTKAERLVDISTELNRHPNDILMHNVARASAMANALEYQLGQQGDEPDAATVRAYTVAVESASRLAKTALDSNLDERKLRAQEVDVRRFAKVLLETVKDARISMTPTQQTMFLTLVAEKMRTNSII